MRSIDTNVLVRWITRDDDEQAAAADRVLVGPTYVPLTVMMETAWILAGSRYGFGRAVLAETLLAVVDTETVHVPSRAGVRWAIERFSKGADLADALHLVASAGADAFTTFDRRLARQVGPDTPLPVELLA